MRKAPAFQFYPGDWMRDVPLRACTVAARGLWIDLLCLMWDGNPRGYLRVGERVLDERALSSLVGVPLATLRVSLRELIENGVVSRAEDGALFSRRMLRDEEIRNARAQGGKLGGNPQLVGVKVNHEVGPKVNQTPNLRPTPASSSASASALSGTPVETLTSSGNGGEMASVHADRLRAQREEIEWRVKETWTTHCTARRRWYVSTTGKTTALPEFTDELQAAIRAAIKSHDRSRLGPEDRERWRAESPVRAAGIGIFYSTWHTGTDPRNNTTTGGKRYLEPWRPWKAQRGKPDPVPEFAELYFERKAS